MNLSVFVPVQVVVGGKAYTYKHSGHGPSLAPRDTVVVPFGLKGLVVGIVESVNQIPLDPNAKFRYKWIAAKVDLTLYNQLLEEEAAAAATTAA